MIFVQSKMHCNYLKVPFVKVVNKEVKLLYLFSWDIFRHGLWSTCRRGGLGGGFFQNSDLDYLLKAVAMDFKVMITLVALDFSWLGDGLSHKCDIPWKQSTKVHLTHSS